MNLEDRLRDDAADQHPNPLAGRGPALVAAARRRRSQRHAGAFGVAAAALVAVTLAVPGPWRDGAVVGDPTTPITEPSEPTEPQSTDDVAPEPTEPTPGAIRPELCEVPYNAVNPPHLPAPASDVSDVQVRTVGPMVSDGVPAVRVMLGNTSEESRTVMSDATELFLVDRFTLETVGYAAVDAEPAPIVLEPGVPTELWQSFDPRTCTGDPLPDGWYLLFARGPVVESDPWLAHPTLIGWVDGEPGIPPSDTSQPADPDRAVPLDPFADPWVAPDTTSGGLEIAGSMPTTPLSSRWDGADSIQQIVPVTNTGAERFHAQVWAWVILVDPETEQSIAVEPPWTRPQDLDLAPGETANISAVHWLGKAAAFEHKLWTDPATWPGTYDAYIVLVDTDSYDPVTGEAFTYAVAGPYPLTVE